MKWNPTFLRPLTIDNQDLDALNWTFIKQEPMRTARKDFDIYTGTLRIDR